MDRYVNLQESKKEESNWNNSDYKVAIKALKNDKDGRIPTKKAEMVALWDRIKDRESVMMKEHQFFLDEINQDENAI